MLARCNILSPVPGQKAMTMQSLCPNESQVTAVPVLSDRSFNRNCLQTLRTYLYFYSLEPKWYRHKNVSFSFKTKVVQTLKKKKLFICSNFVIISRLAIRLSCKVCSHANTSVFGTNSGSNEAGQWPPCNLGLLEKNPYSLNSWRVVAGGFLQCTKTSLYLLSSADCNSYVCNLHAISRCLQEWSI